MQIRKYRPEDCATMAKLFYETVHTVNARDYSKEQLDAWATGSVDEAEWNRSFLAHHTLVAIEHGGIVGFADMDETGYLDWLYVHRDYQRRGIATGLCDALEAANGAQSFVTHASITAKPFFEARGYRAEREQVVERFGVFMKNYIMKK